MSRRPRLSYANVVASLALFIGLGGSAVAAATLERDSVGSREISRDAVRSPELAADAVRPSEIAAGAVRSSELSDSGIKLADLADGARTGLLPDVLVAELDDGDAVPECDDLTACPNVLALNLAAGEASGAWLVQAKADILVQRDNSRINQCGLVNTRASGNAAVLDQVGAPFSGESSDGVSLTAVVKKGVGDPTVALRCTAFNQFGDPDRVSADEVKITAIQVGAVTGP